MSKPKLGEETSTQMQNYSSQVDMSELGACCLDLLPSTSTPTFEAAAMQTGMIRPESNLIGETIGRNTIGYCNELEELINPIEQLPNDLEEKISSLKLETTTAKHTFENQTLDFLYGSVIRDAEIALIEVQSQPGTIKSNKMIEYYSKHCLFILSLIKQEKASCMKDNGVCNDEMKFMELKMAKNCLDKLAKCFAEISSSRKK